jgi:signal transduction histidine kinase
MLPIDWGRLRRQCLVWSALSAAVALLGGAAVAVYILAPAPLNLLLALLAGASILAAAFWLAAQLRQHVDRLQTAYSGLADAAEDRAKSLAGLNEIVEVVSQSMDLQEILISALDKTVEIMGASGGGIALWQAPQAELKLAAYRGLSPRLVEQLDAPGPANPLRDLLGSATPQLPGAAQAAAPIATLWAEAGVSGVVSAPLTADGALLGTLFLVNSTGRPHRPQDTALLTSISHQISAAIYRARLYEAQRRQAQEAETLRQAGGAVTAALRLEDAVERILMQLDYVVPYDLATVQLLREGYLEVVGGSGWPDRQEVMGLRFPVPGENPNSLVLQSQQPVILADAPAAYSLFKTAPFAKRISSWMGVPLIFRGQTIGLLALDSSEPDYFTADHARQVAAFADQVAIAVEHANLYEQTQQELAERKRAQQQLTQAKEAAEAADRAKSTFLTNMGHELRTPLHAILGYSEMLQEEAREGEIGHLAEDMEKIQSAGRRLLDIVNNLLDLSKVEAGSLALAVQAFDLPELLDAVVAAVRPELEQNRNTLRLELAEAPGQMRSDPAKVRQILVNVLGNAAKFTQGGVVKFTVAPVAGADPAQIMFRIADTGIGLTPDEMHNLFQAFTQADASTTRKYGGAGLGLSISRRFCQLLGGDIGVESEKGVGSTFTVRLPAALPEAASADSAAEAAGAIQVSKIRRFLS